MPEYFNSHYVDHFGDKLLVPSSFVCLFWLSDDGEKIFKTAGEIEFFNSDIVARKDIDPKGMHDDYVVNSY